MHGKVECLLVWLVVLAVLHGGRGVPTETRSQLAELLATRASATCDAVVNNGNLVGTLPNASYLFSFKGHTKRVAKVTLSIARSKIFVFTETPYDEKGRIVIRGGPSKKTHVIMAVRFGFHSDCERIPSGGEKFSYAFEETVGGLIFSVRPEDIPATKRGDCCFPCFVAEVDVMHLVSGVVRTLRPVTSEKCKRRSGGDRICSVGSICRNV
mmetsp:Transcript_22274/g.89851  ORF Transcript_22274/g.89851 Transcript_22274/m.89851 type:complete len:211 (-) Transcript_22274:144-776(-)|eukprot:CAMPEP_0113968318 /NCGR_PEP_ID=MMETSP0011_2-20120614/9463_1 /TAXON_ID=101924 /ORGANISM="Rhodosorus marinus" /LENGTH=210 /DNA_ID=CAMNT_0000981387 /DNA_START=527 /DNA_END=1159 /DNA_ORIENTATION=+ /assembly_acc=CAM_ASM_000156